MSKRLWSGTVTALVCTAGLVLSAQTYPSSQNPSSSDKDKGQTVTVTGCVARASQAAIGTSGSSTEASSNPSGMSSSSSSSSKSSGANEKFILTNVTAGTSGTSSSSGMSAASTYRLDADDSKLSSHVGHTVEITGRVESSAASAMPAAEPGSANPSEPGANPSAAAASSNANAPKLKVESVRMISSSCPQ